MAQIAGQRDAGTDLETEVIPTGTNCIVPILINNIQASFKLVVN
jgi:hypothetical protein